MPTPSHAIEAERSMPVVAGVVETLNAITIGVLQLEAALSVVAHLASTADPDPMAQAMALQAYVRDARLGEDALLYAAALEARVTARAAWSAEHDPRRQSNAHSVIEAAARFPMSDTSEGIRFDAPAFQEMVLFIEELPW
jgi:hypothetical protein